MAEDNTTQEGKELRSQVMSYLRQEGFVPTVDSNSGRIEFMREGKDYYISFVGSKPVALDFRIEGFDIEDANLNACYATCSIVTRDMYYVKCYVPEDKSSIRISVEFPCASISAFKGVFYEIVKTLSKAKSQLQEHYNEATSGSSSSSSSSSDPFSIKTCAVANEDYNYNIIDDFDSKLYASRVKYITPRISIASSSSGSYTIYYDITGPQGKMYRGSSSPSGHTNSTQLNIESGTQTYVLKGWGANDSSYWSKGKHRITFWVDGKNLGYYEFEIL